MALWLLGPDPAGTCCDCAGRTSPCDSCEEPIGCSCALLIPSPLNPYESPFATVEEAQAALADFVASCIAYFEPVVDLDSFSADASTPNTLELDAVASNPDFNSGVEIWASISLKAASVLSVAYTVSSTAVSGGDDQNFASVLLYKCDGTPVEAQSVSGTGTQTGTFTFAAITEDGEYLIRCIAEGQDVDPSAATTCTASFTATSDDTIVINPVIALYDDSGTTRQLEACPKMLLPPLTESTGEWYASLAAANAVLASYQIAPCKGFLSYTTDSSAPFSLSGGTGSVTISQLNINSVTGGGIASAGNIMLLSLNLTTSTTVSIQFTVTMPSAQNNISATVGIYDSEGVLLDSQYDSSFSQSPPWIKTFTYNVPYTGRFIFELTSGGNQGSFSFPFQMSASVLLSSSGLTTNSIQALYATTPLLDCPARLDC